ncbi:MAG: transcription antitermination factor NusB [Hyphomicrobium sp.]
MTAKNKPASDKPNPISARTAARVAAVQALYQMELSEADLNDVIAEFLRDRFEDAQPEETIEGADRIFFADVLRAVLRRQREIDPLVDEQLAEGWSLVRVDAILRAVLRGGVAELLDRGDVPARVVINEYVNVARFFFSEDEPRVVNGVLDKIARKVRSAEFVNKRAGG